jgi:Thioredoxin domain
MLSDDDRKRIAAWDRSGQEKIRITLTAEKDEAGRILGDFCDELVRCAPRISLKRKRPDSADTLPAIGIGERIRYHAVPIGPELPVFLSCLDGGGTDGGAVPSKIREALSRVTLPALLTVFISSRCRFCPETVRRLEALTAVAPAVRLSIVDAERFPEQAARHEVQSVPTVILDDQLRWTGGVDLPELADGIIHRDPARLSAASLRGVIEDGKAAQVAQMMMAADTLFPALFELLTDEKWPVRLGAMVTLENLAAASPHMARGAVEAILERLPASSDPVKGDLLYLLGEIGGTSLVTELRAYQSEAFAETVREAASDAVDAILSRDDSGA